MWNLYEEKANLYRSHTQLLFWTYIAFMKILTDTYSVQYIT